MARNPVGNADGFNRPVLSALIIFCTCCMVFSGVSFAQETPESGPQPATAEGAQEAAAQPAASESAPVDVDTELELILKSNNRCLRCHTRDRTKELEDGTELSLKIHREDFMSSAHGEVACTSCHVTIESRGRHPSSKTNVTIASQRNLALEMNESCRECHAENYDQFEGSIHSNLISQGSEKAPLCSDCHSAHAIKSVTDLQLETGYPCRQCHEPVYTAYRESVHGSARLTGNEIRDEHIEAPICSDCHSSHAVTAMEIGDVLRGECFGCHENVPLLHSQWLPNAELHLDVVSCAVCHAPFAKHRFDLHFFDAETQKPVGQQETHDLFVRQLAALGEEGGTVDPLAVWKLIEEDNQLTPDNITLRGRMEVRSGVWAHQIAPKSFAVRTCDSCHLPGHRERMGYTVSVPQQDGRVQQFDAGKDAMSSAAAVVSIGDFKVFGISVNKMLDIMFLLSLGAGIAVPVAHFTLGKMIKEKLDRGEL
mgnify:CR=1 FL=1